jgi:hypothetical protein
VRRRIRTYVSWLLLASILLVNLPLVPPAAAQKLLPVEQHGTVFKVVSKYLAGGIGLPDSMLERCGFVPAVGAEAWAHFPPAYKIEAAYHAAEAASPGGGEVWLALLAQELARRYESAANDPLLRRLLSGGGVKGCPSFVAPNPPYRPKLSSRHRAIVNRLASYCGGAATGYIADTVARHFMIPFGEARKIFAARGHDIETGLEESLELVDERYRRSRLQALYEYLASRSESVRRDPLVRELEAARLEETRAGASKIQSDSFASNAPPELAETHTRPRRAQPLGSELIGSGVVASEWFTSPATSLDAPTQSEDFSDSLTFESDATESEATPLSLGLRLSDLTLSDTSPSYLGAPGIGSGWTPMFDIYSPGRYPSLTLAGERPLALPTPGARAPLAVPGGLSPQQRFQLDVLLRRYPPADVRPPLRTDVPAPATAVRIWPREEPVRPLALEPVQRDINRRGVYAAPRPGAPSGRNPAPARVATPQPPAAPLMECVDDPRRP